MLVLRFDRIERDEHHFYIFYIPGFDPLGSVVLAGGDVRGDVLLVGAVRPGEEGSEFETGPAPAGREVQPARGSTKLRATE